MKFVVTAAEMALAEDNAEKGGIAKLVLMENAGRACYENIEKSVGGVSEKTFAIICGRGNNGGDGLEIAANVIENGGTAVVIYVSDLPKSTVARMCYSKHEGKIPIAMYTHKEDSARQVLKSADVIVDCVFGTGFRGELEPKVAELFAFINSECSALKIAVDVPSGCNADTGEVAENAFVPSITLTLGAIKQGQMSHPCFDLCGNLTLLDIGLKDEHFTAYTAVLTNENVMALQPARAKSSNKGSFGRMLNIAGSERYPGAAILSSKGGLRTGTGLVMLASPRPVIGMVVSAMPETVYLPLEQDGEGFMGRNAFETLIQPLMDATSAVVGCGIGVNENNRRIVRRILETGNCPMVLDADGINCVNDNINVLKDSTHPLVVTPHPKEFARFADMTAEDVQQNRITIAKAFAKEFGVVLVLKGINTVISAPDGRTFINTTGNTALAKAGTGDVLSGIIGSFLAQGVKPLEAAVLGVYVHGKCADMMVKQASAAGITAGDLVDYLPFVLK